MERHGGTVLKPGKTVVVRRVDVVFVNKTEWKCEGSTAGAQGGGRTHTFGLRLPAQTLRDAAAYRLPNVKLQGGEPVLVE
jgi:hypothetical protein